jgi:TetR/AcrR family transcriptional regulator, fatty acid metabolism regulator protein
MRTENPRAERRDTFTGRARRAQLLACAVDALVEVGYAQSSIAEIARRAGVSKGVVSYHFASKEELLTGVVADLYEEAGAQIGARVERAVTAEEALRGYLEANLGFITAHPRLIRAAAEVVVNLRRPDGTLMFRPGPEDPVVKHLQELLEAGQASGEFRRFEPAAMALLIRSAIDVASARLAVEPGFDIETYQRELITFVHLATRKEP